VGSTLPPVGASALSATSIRFSLVYILSAAVFLCFWYRVRRRNLSSNGFKALGEQRHGSQRMAGNVTVQIAGLELELPRVES
jgi:hypothetical protein